jgi:hypothetical protein
VTQIIQVGLSDGRALSIQALGEHDALSDVGAASKLVGSFSGVMADAAQAASEALEAVSARIAPSELAIEFSVGFAMEGGQLTALLVSGSAEATLKITATWKQADRTLS